MAHKIGRPKLPEEIWLQRARITQEIRQTAKQRRIPAKTAAELAGIDYHQLTYWERAARKVRR